MENKFLFSDVSLPPSLRATSLVRGRQERLPLTRELSPKVTEGENYKQEFILSFLSAHVFSKIFLIFFKPT